MTVRARDIEPLRRRVHEAAVTLRAAAEAKSHALGRRPSGDQIVLQVAPRDGAADAMADLAEVIDQLLAPGGILGVAPVPHDPAETEAASQ